MIPVVRSHEVRVLLALESSESAHEPARLSNALFGAARLRIRAIHVRAALFPDFYLPPGFGLDSLRRQTLALERAALRGLERRVEPLRAMGFEVETEVTSGSPLAELRKRARLWRSDVILARPHRAGLDSPGLGGVAAGLMQTAPAPVLLHRRVPAGYRVDTILAPIDFSPFSRRAVGWALFLASLTGARVRLLHALVEVSRRRGSPVRRAAIEAVEGERRWAERQLRGRFRNPAIAVDAGVIETTDPARSVLEAGSKGADLVVLGSSGKSGLTAVLGSVARRVARECPCPVLVLPAASRVSAMELWQRVRRETSTKTRTRPRKRH